MDKEDVVILHAQAPTSLWLDLARLLDEYRRQIRASPRDWLYLGDRKYWHDASCRAETLRELLNQDRICADRCMELMEAAALEAELQTSTLFPDQLKVALSYFMTSDTSIASSHTVVMDG